MRSEGNQEHEAWRGLESLESRVLLSAASFSEGQPFTGTDPISGNSATFTITGPGTGTLVENPTDSAWDLTLTGTTRKTVVKITATGNPVDLQSITAATMVGGIIAPNVDFYAASGHEDLSTMAFTGGLLSLVLHDSSAMTTGVHNVTVGCGDSAKDALSLTLNIANDLNFDCQMPISSLTAAGVAGHTDVNPDIYSHAYMGKVVISGNLTGIDGQSYPHITVDGANPANGLGIASVTIGGNIDCAEVYSSNGDIGPVKVSGHMNNGASINASQGAVGKVWVGGYMDHNSQIYSELGGIGTVHVGGSMDHNSQITVNGGGNIGAVWVGGNMDNSARVYISGLGNIASVFVKGNLDHDSAIYSGRIGKMGPVTIGGNVDNSSAIYTENGSIASVTIGGNLDNSSQVNITNGGDIGNVRIGGNVDNGANVNITYGNIKSVTIGGNLDNGGEVYGLNGNVYSVKIAGNFDHDSQVYAGGGVGIGTVMVGKNFSNGAKVESTTAIKSVKIAGSSTGTSGAKPFIHARANIGAISIGGQSTYADFQTDRSFGTITVGGMMQNGQVICNMGGDIKSLTVGQLDATKIYCGVTDTAGFRSDFITQNSSIGKLTIRGLKTGDVTKCMTGNSEIVAWSIGTLKFVLPSDGSGLIEYHAAKVINAPTSVLQVPVP